MANSMTGTLICIDTKENIEKIEEKLKIDFYKDNLIEVQENKFKLRLKCVDTRDYNDREKIYILVKDLIEEFCDCNIAMSGTITDENEDIFLDYTCNANKKEIDIKISRWYKKYNLNDYDDFDELNDEYDFNEDEYEERREIFENTAQDYLYEYVTKSNVDETFVDEIEINIDYK